MYVYFHKQFDMLYQHNKKIQKTVLQQTDICNICDTSYITKHICNACQPWCHIVHISARRLSQYDRN